VSAFYLILVFFLYGLAFFSMGLVITQEVGRCSDARLRHALWYLAGFGLLHGIHEWYEMFQAMRLTHLVQNPNIDFLRLVLLALSFLSLTTFGSLLLSPKHISPRLVMLVPVILAGVWSFGLLILRNYVPIGPVLWDAYDVWTRYVLAIPGSIMACTGLIVQQREFRRVGLAQFGRDSLWAAVAFAWYGLIGQAFTRPSIIPPSTFLNSELFLIMFGFPIQFLRAGAAIVTAIFVIRFLRSFEVETQRKIAALQAERLEEAQRREIMYGELLRRVVEAQETERQRVARELHDETGQALTAIGLGLRGATTILHQDAEKAALNLRKLEGMVAASLNELQRLIADLRPSHLDDLGLPAALRWYCNALKDRVGLVVKFEIQGQSYELPSEVKIALFRVAQEALTNVVKHARAKSASVFLCYQPEGVVLEVKDRGCGFDPLLLHNPTRPSWGLLGMEERAMLLGGKLRIDTQKDKGTTVQVIIPFSRISEVKDDHPVSIG
jgi:signal transduction histidine kinase